MATRGAHTRLPLEDPGIPPSVPANSVLVNTALGVHVLGFRMPAYKSNVASLKRRTWDWLLASAATLRERPTIIAGDFNTAPGDPRSYCGDCLETLPAMGWTHALPRAGCSWRSRTGSERRIDHAFVSPALSLLDATYSWNFQALATTPTSNHVGLPDHAMLLVECRTAQLV